jgi:hypothetical protein
MRLYVFPGFTKRWALASVGLDRVKPCSLLDPVDECCSINRLKEVVVNSQV